MSFTGTQDRCRPGRRSALWDFVMEITTRRGPDAPGAACGNYAWSRFGTDGKRTARADRQASPTRNWGEPQDPRMEAAEPRWGLVEWQDG